MPQLWKDLALWPADYFRSYQATYLERDVRQLLNVASLRDFDRFMRATAVRSGQLLNRTELGKEVGVSAKTVNALRKHLHIDAPEATVWFYRDQSREVDFVIDRDGQLTLAESKWKELPTARDFGQAMAVQALLPRVRWPIMVLCRARQSHPVAENAWAVDGYRLWDHL